MSLTPPASSGMQDLLMDVTVDVPSHEIEFQSLASKKRLSQKQRKRARLRAQVSDIYIAYSQRRVVLTTTPGSMSLGL